MPAVLTNCPRGKNVLCPRNSSSCTDLLFTSKENFEGKHEDFENPDPPTNKQPVKQPFPFFDNASLAHSNAASFYGLDVDIRTSTLRTNHFFYLPNTLFSAYHTRNLLPCQIFLHGWYSQNRCLIARISLKLIFLPTVHFRLQGGWDPFLLHTQKCSY